MAKSSQVTQRPPEKAASAWIMAVRTWLRNPMDSQAAKWEVGMGSKPDPPSEPQNSW